LDPGSATLSGPEHFGWRLSEAITEGEVQGKPRTARRGSGKARVAGDDAAKARDGPQKRADPARTARPRANGGSRKRAHPQQLPRLASPPPSAPGAAPDGLAHHVRIAEGGTAMGWPEHWAAAGEARIALAPAAEPAAASVAHPRTVAQGGAAPQRATLLRRLGGLLGGRRDV
jgi:hypothetical protein